MTQVEGTPLTLRKMTIPSGYSECQVRGNHRKLPCFGGGGGRCGWDVYRKREEGTWFNTCRMGNTVMSEQIGRERKTLHSGLGRSIVGDGVRSPFGSVCPLRHEGKEEGSGSRSPGTPRLLQNWGLHRAAVSGPALVLGAIQPREPLKVLQQVSDWNTVSHRTVWSQDARWVLLRDLLEGPGAVTPVPATGLQPDCSPQTCFLHPSSQTFGIFFFFLVWAKSLP